MPGCLTEVKTDMFEKVKKAIAEILIIDEDRITLDSRIKADLKADSLDVLQLLMELDDKYGIEIPDEALADFDTVGDIVSFLENLTKK